MGKRRKAIKVKGEVKESQKPLPTVFNCLFCNHERSIIIKLDKKNSIGSLHCNICGQTYQTSINYLSGAVDVYADWVDAADEVKKEQRRAAKRGGASSGGGGESRGDPFRDGLDENGNFVKPREDVAPTPAAAQNNQFTTPPPRASVATAAAEGSANPPIRSRPRSQVIDLDSDPSEHSNAAGEGGGGRPARPPSDISSISDHGAPNPPARKPRLRGPNSARIPTPPFLSPSEP
ncbi:uncharacterized protein DFL_007750 [Arthrobotrys flagrans]|uniref:Transcription elongation factor 1 homolog n=1 Tax=Arthrobotrys flagrans TaxID=97331 RepID=A0A436ZWU1_ARTFL|nr:hypothetical protein DFL_007750 [Arthrobotrys flagrans]